MVKLQNVLKLLSLAVLMPACMSLELSPDTEPAEDLYFAKPGGGFLERDSDNLDGYFVEPKSGNSISIKSSCFDPADPSIDTLKKSAFSGMTIVESVSEEKSRFSKRAALSVVKKVSIDGVPVKVEMLIFKKNSCNYIISHVGVANNFQKTKSQYDNFLKNVKAP